MREGEKEERVGGRREERERAPDIVAINTCLFLKILPFLPEVSKNALFIII